MPELLDADPKEIVTITVVPVVKPCHTTKCLILPKQSISPYNMAREKLDLLYSLNYYQGV